MYVVQYRIGLFRGEIDSLKAAVERTERDILKVETDVYGELRLINDKIERLLVAVGNQKGSNNG